MSKPIIGAAAGRHPAAVHRERADRAAGNPGDVGGAALIHQCRPRVDARPGGGDKVRGRTDETRRAGERCAHRFADRCNPRRHQRAAAGAEHLQIDVIVTGVDRRHDRRQIVLRDMGGGEAGERRQADRRLAGGERNAARGRNADAQAGKAARACGDGDAVKVAEIDAGAVHDPRDQRHQRFGMTAVHEFSLGRHDRPAARVEHGRCAGFERGIDGKDAHFRSQVSVIRYQYQI
jgi:hypothetical protein